MQLRRLILAAAAAAVLAALAAALAAGTAAPGQAASAAHALRDCQAVQVPVSLAPRAPTSYQVSGTYCLPYGRHGSTVDVLVPGNTYNRGYWDPPVDPVIYSFVDHDLQVGRATLAIDRIGTGASSEPDPLDVTIQSDAYTVHQVIAWARTVAGFPTVNVIGHSLGSMVASLDAAQYPADPSRLVLTGMLHSLSHNLLTFFASDLHSADKDPVLAGGPLGNLPADYVTTVPGTRGQVFYHDGDPAVVAWDEASKDVTSLPEAVNNGQPLDLTYTRQITAPVLLVVGQDDDFFCQGSGAADCSSAAAVRAAELPDYTSAASLCAVVVPGTGHDVALSQTALMSFAAISAWLQSPHARP